MKLGSKLNIVLAACILLAMGLSMVAVQLSTSNGRIQPLLLLTILAVEAAVLIATISLFLNRQILNPIKALSAAVARISLGDLSQKVTVNSNDELGVLGRSFNEMTQQLSSTYRSLEASTHSASEGRAQLESSINGLRQGFIFIDLHNVVTLANVAAVEIARGEGAGHQDKGRHEIPSLEEIVQVLPKDLNLTSKIAQTLKNRKLAKYPGLALAGRYINLYLSPVLSGAETIGCVLLLEDVTEERIIARSRDEFFSIASHELRTPLTAIRGNTTMLQQYFPKLLKDPVAKDMISDIHESTTRLITIVNDFLDTSRLEQNKMKLTPTCFKLEQTIEKIIYEMAGLSRDKHINLLYDQDTLGKLPLVYADAGRITQVVYNLIGNAMKFTENGKITINCLIESRFVKVCVSDTGLGISEEGQQILFHKFQQSTASILTRDSTRGTGLGLYISKLLVQHMGGTIKLEHSEPGKGSVFSFTVPIATKTQLKAIGGR